MALDKLELRPGEICLLARVVNDVPGLTVVPGSGQSRQAALLVAHLTAGSLHVPEADTNVAVPPMNDPQIQGGARGAPLGPAFPPRVNPQPTMPVPEGFDPSATPEQ